MADLIKVLIVDDNPKCIEDILRFYGYEVSSAIDGEQALKILDTTIDIDLILLDVHMPKMSGWDTIKAIRKHPFYKNIPVIMLTAVAEDQKMVMGLKLGADDYIVKPFVLTNLLARMEALLRRAKRLPKQFENPNVTISQAQISKALTQREKDVLLLVTQGNSNESIAEKLSIADTTVKSHISAIFKKLKVKNRTQAVLVAMQAGLIEN